MINVNSSFCQSAKSFFTTTFLWLLLFALPTSKVVAQCGYNNTFYINYVPVYDGAAHLANGCFWGGDLMTMTVVAGGTYTFSTCSSTSFDSEITVYDATGTTVLGFNDDACGATGFSSQLTVTAGYSGTMNVLIDQYNCISNTGPCMPMYVTSTSPPPPPPPVGPPCPLTGSSAGTVTPGCGAFGGQLSIPSTAYASFNAVTGVNYSVSTCASGWDSEISGYDAGNNFIGSGQTSPTAGGTFYNDDNGSICATTRASLDWTSYFTGTVKVMVDRYACGSVWPGTSALLEIRQNTTISNATSTASICGDGSTRPLSVTYGGTFSGSPTVTWNIVSGPGSVSGTTYTASGVVGASQVVTLGATLGACSFTTSFTVYGVPSASVAGSAQTQCGNGTFTMAANTPSVGTGTWTVTSGSATIGSANSPTSTISAIAAGSSATLTWTITNGTCSSSSSSVVLTNNTPATANAGSAQTICAGGVVTLAASIGGSATSSTWSAPSGSFSNTASLTSTYTPSISSGTVTLTLTTNDPAGVCTAATSTVIITVNAAASASAGTAQTVCAGGTITLSGTIGGSASSSTWSAPSGSFSNTASLGSTYTPSIASGTVTLTLTTNDPDGGGPCSAATSTVIITVNQAATANAGSAQTVCGGGTVTLAGSIGGSATSSTWSAGTGSFSNANSLTSTYTPSITSGTVTLTLTTNDPDGAGPCSAATSTVTITVNQAATANAGFAQSVCQGGSVTLAGSIGGSAASSTWTASSGVFSNATSLTSTYTPSISSGTVTLTLTTNDPDGAGPCSAAVSTVVITVNQAPTVSAGSAQTVCGGGTITLAGSIGGSATSSTWSAGTGSFSNAASLTSTYTPSITSGTVTLTLTTNDPDGAGPCSAVSSTVVITVNQAATANAGFPQTVCEGSSITLAGSIGGSAASSTWTASSGTFSNATSLTSTYTPSISSGTVTLTLTTNDPDGAGPCSAAVSTLVITVNQASTVSAGSAQTVCAGGTITLAGSIGGSATTSTWSAGTGSFSNVNSLTSTYTPSISSGTVTLTLTTNDPDGAGPCAAVSSTVIITVNQAATANAGVPQTTCQGSTIILAGTIGGSATSSTWTAGSGTFSNASSLGSSYTPSISSGTVTLTLTTNDPDGAGPCSAAVSTVVITVDQAATANAGSTQTVCQNGTITLAGNIGGSAISSTWSAPTGTFSNTSSLTSTYSPSITSGTVTLTLTTNDPDGVGPCPAATSTVVITVTPLPAVNSVTPTAVLCFGGNTGTISVNASNGTPPLSYSIDNGATYQASNFFNNLTAGSYNVVVRDVQTCSTPYALNPVVVTQPTLLDHTTTVTDASCANVFDGKIDVFASGGVAPYAYSLNGGPTQVGSQFTGLQSGAYVVYVYDVNGCVDTSHVVINDAYNVSSFIVSQTDVSCFGGSNGAVTVQIVGGIPAYQYSINGTIFSASPTFTGLTSGNYVVILRDSKGCTAFQPVSITQPAQLSAIVDVVNSVSCNGTATGEIFISVNGGTAPYTYFWSNGDTTQDVDSLLAGTYTATITDSKGCTAFTGATVAQPLALFVNVAGHQDLRCYNDSTGSIDISVSGGVPAYTYLWSNGATTEDLSGLHAGTYTVTVNDNNLCEKIITQTLSEPTQLTSSIVGSSVSCNGVSNGTVDLTPSGGTLPYTFQWSNATTNEDLTNVSAGTYSVIITDAHGCISTNTTSVSQPTGLGLTTAITNVLCFGNATGAIDLTVTGGTPGYTYLWNDGDLNEDRSGLTAGGYSVVVTDNNSCSSSVGVTITQPSQALGGSLIPTAVTCFGANNGSVNLTVTGGTQPYTFLWSNTATTEDISGLSGGTYSVTITDANGCQFNVSTTVNEPAVLATSNEWLDVTCYGGNDGDIQLYVFDGNPPYTFLWSNFATTQNITNLTAGTYTVIVTDSKGCQTITSITVSQPAPLVITGVVTNVSCNGVNDGAIDVTVTGGTGAYFYSWDNSTSTEDQSSLVAGTYSLTVTDENGCSITASFTVTQPAVLAVSGVTTDVNCSGNSNGSINNTVTGGTAPYTFGWSNNASSEDLSGLSGGTYDVTITDAHGCSVSASYTINEPNPIVSSIVGTNVTCHGAANGSADLTVSGGSVPYTFLWSTFQNGEDLINVGGGTYYVIITDANGCQHRDSVIITEPAAITISVATTNVLCNGDASGGVDITVNGGTPTITFVWSNSTSSEDLVSVVAGNYSVTITDGNGCTASATATVTQPAALVLNSTVTNVGCAGGANGSVDITVQGGVFPYSYLWSNSATTEDIHNVSGGNYSVTITDANGCSLSASFTVSEPVAMTASITPTPVSCFGGNDGAADLTVSDGTPPYTYLWSTFATTEDLTGLTAGNYVAIVTDANGCQKITTTTITQPTQIVVSGVVTNLSCNSSSDGFIDISVSGGTPGYTFAWSNSTSSEDQSNIVAGTYTVTVFDANLCTATATFTVTQPAALTVSGTTTDVNCNGGASGAINITVAGGTNPYGFNWSNGATTEDISGLSGGPYSVIVTDANLCSASAAFNISEPAAITSSIVGTNVLCHGANSGAADLTVSGGANPYTFLWNTFQNTEDLINLNGGIYRVIITDANGCQHRDSVIITEPAAITISVVTTSVLCNGDASGAVDITVNGGTPSINYDWSNGATIEDISGVAAGNYSVTITDGNGCTASASATVTQPAALVLNSTVTNVACAGGASGSVDITIQGGVFPYSYSWSNTATTEDIHNVSGGNYSVTVLDANGCSLSASFTVSEPMALTASTIGTNVLCHGDNSGAVDLTVSGGVPAYTYIWTNGATTEDLSGLAGGTYTVVVHDANGCSVVASQIITEPAAITISVVTTNVLCNGDASGAIDITVNGGTPTINYAWSNGATIEDLSGVVAGNYSVTITDGNGCTASATATVTQPAALVLNSTVTNVTCAGGANGSVDITVQGGVFPYTYAWSNTATTEDIHNVSGGNYSVTVMDANGCSLSASFTVSEPTALIASTTGTNVSCHGANDGSVDLTVSGGVPADTYIWTNGAITEDLSGLAGGTYTVVVHDANGCSVVASQVISEPTAIVATVAVTNVLCNGNATGTVDLTVTGGSGSYTFGWSNSTSSEDLVSVVAGNYSVTITDGNGCTATASATVTQPAALLLTGTKTDVSCNGGSNGTINISLSGGVTPYSFAWSNGATTEDLSGLIAGTYTCNATDANGCSVSASFTIGEPSAITSSVVGTDLTCHGAANGSAVLTVNGGTPNYSFAWSNFQVAQNISNLSGGTYFVIITDANGCNHRDSVIIAEPSALVLSITTTTISCNGGASDVDLTVSGGTLNYSYAWDNGALTQDLTGVAAGTYTVVVTDGNGCTASATTIVAQPLALLLSGNATDVHCAGGNDGAVNISVGGGTTPYSFSWSNGPVTEDVQNLSAGNYSVTVTDLSGCTASASFTIAEPTGITSSVTGTNVTCQGANNGTATLSVSGGTLPYTFFWSNFQGSQNIANLDGGIYYVLITDANGCTHRDSVIIGEPSQITINVDSAFDISCFANQDGAIYISVVGGTPNYTYLWSDVAHSTTQDITGLIDAVYVVTVTDANGCTASKSINIARPSLLSLNAIINTPRCNADLNGSIDLIPSGGTPSYSYVWRNAGGAVIFTTEDISGIGAATYTVVVTDVRGCTAYDTLVVSEPSAFYISDFLKNPTCHGFSDGYLDVTAYGGTLPYDFHWNDGTTTEDLYNLRGDSAYYVTATDANGCLAQFNDSLVDPAAISVIALATDVSCFGGNNGTLTGSATGGIPPYRYIWSTFDTTASIANVMAGHYVLQVTDSFGCYNSDTADVIQPTDIAIAGNVTNAVCFGGTTGEIDITVSGGTPNYTFAWTGGSTNKDLTNAIAGTDTVRVTDSKGCVKAASFVITQPTAIYLSILSNQPSCNGSTNGSLSVVAAQGVPAYTYAWSTVPSQTTPTISNLSAGDYTVTVTDSKGCTVAATQTLAQPAAIDVSVNATATKCSNTADGKVIVTASGGLAPYIYELNGLAQLTDTFTGVGAGNYLVIVSDANGCEGTDTFSITQPASFTVTLSTQQQTILTGMQTQIFATVTPAQHILNYFWTPDSLFDFTQCDPLICDNPFAAPRSTTVLMVLAMNSDSCYASDTITIFVNNEASKFIPTAFTPNGDGLNDRFEFDILGATKLDVTIYTRWGDVVFHNDDQTNGMNQNSGWDGTKNGKACPFDTYVYKMKITYFDASVVDVTGTVTLMH